jgi:hypothetical protein
MKHFISCDIKEIRFRDEKGDPLEGDQGRLDWKMFIHKVEDNPKWATTYKLTRAMDDIWLAYNEMMERGDNVMELEDFPYTEFESACQNPKYSHLDPIHGPKEVLGWGVHARLNRQMICFPKAVVNAVDVDPRKKVEKGNGKSEAKSDELKTPDVVEPELEKKAPKRRQPKAAQA